MSSVANHFRAGEYGFSVASAGFERYSSRKAFIEGYLRDLSFSEDPRLAALVGAMYDSLSGGGERVRSVLCLEVADTFGVDPAEALPSAAAIELLHTGSLVHDSLPTIGDGHGGRGVARHKDSEEATVILVGDAFFSEALKLAALHQEGGAGQVREVVREIAASTGAGGMVGGQALMVNLAERVVDPETLNAAHSYRTGALLVAAARIGATLGGCTPEEREAVSEYARQFGLCARIRADISDSRSKGDMPGTNGDETGRERNSCVQVYGLSGAWRRAAEALREALEALAGLDRDTRGLAEIVHFAYSGPTTNLLSK